MSTASPLPEVPRYTCSIMLYLECNAVLDKQANLDVHLVQVSLQLLVETNVRDDLLPQLLHL